MRFSMDRFVIAVGTPDEDGSADLRYVLEVAEDIALCMSEYKVIVNSDGACWPAF